MISYAKADDIKSVYDLICELEDTVLNEARFEDAFKRQTADDRYICLLYQDDEIIKRPAEYAY